MSKIKFLIIAVVGLLGLNLAIIGAIFIRERRPPLRGEGSGRNEPKLFVIEKLKFDEKQIMEYEALIEVHRSQRETSNQKIHYLKNELYASVAQGSSEIRDSLIGSVLEEQKKLELINYNHFADIKMLCRPEQQKEFDELSKKLLDIFSRPKPR